jgi:ribosomal-protein-alanine N-acetyltransferase
MIGPRAILSRRLELASMSLAFMTASLDGRIAEAAALLNVSLPDDWPASVARTMRWRVEQLARDPSEQPWLLRAMVPRHDPTRPVIGHINFHAPPGRDGWVEIGYTVYEPWRRQGFGQEAAEALMDWAAREHQVTTFRASVGPCNAPSLALVRKLGFKHIGRQWDDEDGEELVFELQR